MLHTKLRSWVSNSVNPLQTLLTCLKVEKKSCETVFECMQGSCGYIRTSFSIHRHWLFPSKPWSWVSNSVNSLQTYWLVWELKKKSCETAFECMQGSCGYIRTSFSIHRHWPFPSKPQSSVSNSVKSLQTLLTCLKVEKKSCETAFESMQGSCRYIWTPFSIHRHRPFTSKPRSWISNCLKSLQTYWLVWRVKKKSCETAIESRQGSCGHIRTSFSIHRHALFPSKPWSWVSNSVKPLQTCWLKNWSPGSGPGSS
jgi:hypothetical protein